jgi:hypothetical protein
VSAIEFCALTCITIREVGGILGARPEGGHSRFYPNVQGLAYFFDHLDKVPATAPGRPSYPGKASYNTLSMNRRVDKLIGTTDYETAHGNRLVGGHPPSSDLRTMAAWSGSVWPVSVSSEIDPEINGYLIQADFYKFRGRGVIQLTGRSWYAKLMQFLDQDPDTSPDVKAIVSAWQAGVEGGPAEIADSAVTRSTDAEWTALFGDVGVLAAAVRVHSDGSQRYLSLSHQAELLNGQDPGSLYAVGLKVNSSTAYARDATLMMNTMVDALAMKIESDRATAILV